MKTIQNIGIAIFLVGLGIFTALPVMGTFKLDQKTFDGIVQEKQFKSELFISEIQKNVVGKEFDGMLELSSTIAELQNEVNKKHQENKEWNKVVYPGSKDMAVLFGKK